MTILLGVYLWWDIGAGHDMWDMSMKRGGELQNLKVQDLLKWIGFQTSVEDVQAMVRRQPSKLGVFVGNCKEWHGCYHKHDRLMMTHVYLQTYICVCCIYIYIHIYIHTYIDYTYVCIYIYMCVCVCVWLVPDVAVPSLVFVHAQRLAMDRMDRMDRMVRRVDFNGNKTMDMHEFLRLMLLVWRLVKAMLRSEGPRFREATISPESKQIWL